MPTRTTIRRLAWSALFLAGIALPLLAALLLKPPELSRAEARRLTPRPALQLTPAGLAAFPRRFDAFYSDRYGFRATLLRWHSLLKVRVLGISPTSRVIIGREGWLFLGEPKALDNYRPPRLFTERELTAWQRTLEARRDWLAGQGIRYLVVLVPDKQSIYPEYLPAAVRRMRQQSRLQQFVAHMRAHSTVEVLELREALRAAKGEARLYHRTDTHWNGYGAYVGYRELMTRLGAWFPQIQPAPPEAFTVTRQAGEPGLLARMMDAEDSYGEQRIRLERRAPPQAHKADPGPLRADPLGGHAPRATEVGDAALPRAVMYRDSFAEALIPLVSEHFSRIIYVWRPAFHPEVVRREQPQVVIREMGERSLLVYRPHNPRALRRGDHARPPPGHLGR